MSRVKCLSMSLLFLLLSIYSTVRAVEYTVPFYPYDIAPADIDCDGDIDIIVGSNPSGEKQDTISILINDGNGNFDIEFFKKNNRFFIECIDIDNNEYPDIITQQWYNPNYYFVCYYNSEGNYFIDTLNIHISNYKEYAEILDTNNDGDNDIIYYKRGTYDDPYWGILENNGLGEFEESYYFTESECISGIKTGLINSDPLPDILVTGLPCIVYLNNIDSFESINIDTMYWHDYGDMADVNHDGYNDVILYQPVCTYPYSSKLYFYYNNGINSFSQPDTLELECDAIFHFMKDINDDDYPDIIFDWRNAPDQPWHRKIGIRLNNHDGSFSTPEYYYIGDAPLMLYVCSEDFDNNNYPDLAITGYNDDNNHYKVKVLFNDGTGNFSEEPQVGIDPQQPMHGITLHQNNPNPFNNYTTISYSLGNNHEHFIGKNAKIEIYNIKGQLVKRLENITKFDNCHYSAEWDGKNENGKKVNNGVYFAIVRLNGKILKAKKVTIIK